MKLEPKHPPGRATRQARGYNAEIVQLRGRGYTFDAIRQALADVGVHVSRSTVQREAARHQRREAKTSAPSSPPVGPPCTSDAAQAVGTTPSQPAQPQSAKDMAAAFVRGHVTNPLVQQRSRS